MGMESRKTAPVGVFDSGVGGLTVAREISRQLPKENIVYFGDTARVPYGSKSQNTIIRFSEQIIRFLKTKQVKAIVIACNTASALALDAVRDEFDIPIMGVVIPGARAAVEATKNRKVGVVGTDATVQSGMYTKVIREMAPDITVIEKACPLFVPLVEEGFKEHVVTQEIIEYYLESMKHTDIDAMILGCTHYPLIRSKIREYMGDRIQIVNPAYETAMDLKKMLEERGMARLYLTSATPPDLSRAAWLFYGRDARQRDLSPLLERFRPGIAFGFDLLAYPCKKVDVGRANSVRAFLTTPEERRAWLVRQGEKNGFALRALREDGPADMRGKRRTGLVQIRAVRFSGVLEITDAERFRDGYLRGVGPEKAYGLGMLMLRKV